MKTTQGQAVRAFGSLAALDSLQTSSLVAFKLFKLKKSLKEIVEFQCEQEEKLAKQCGGEITEAGRLSLPDVESRMLYAEKHKELEEMECEIDYEKVTLSLSEFPRLTMQCIESLEPYIQFEE